MWWRSVLLVFLSHLGNFGSVTCYLSFSLDAELRYRGGVAYSKNEGCFNHGFCFLVEANYVDVHRDLYLGRYGSVVSPVALPGQICDLNRNSQHDTII